ncbi:hypothetical protein FVE85_3618 [Porphyridium purpureum]|uniref:Uncharacterized protein n=1 Tax=Porphyridium purpureum TaxID=35688 RepID=A0A5J4YMJ9_PORPP|nr:hypothetical protein FVE85_3618 [Porphyridium purpureum]|eukprot:POR7933..scf249_10
MVAWPTRHRCTHFVTRHVVEAGGKPASGVEKQRALHSCAVSRNGNRGQRQSDAETAAFRGERNRSEPKLAAERTSPSGPPSKLVGPFYAIRNGLDSFRGVVMRQSEFHELSANAPNAETRIEPALAQAMEYCLAPSDKAPATFFAFRHGLDAARGIMLSYDIVRRVLPRVQTPTIERLQFCNMVQPLVFCHQADTGGTDWHSLEGSLGYLARHPSLSVPVLMSQFVVCQRDGGALSDLLKEDVRRPQFFAFRRGFFGARGVAISKEVFQGILPRIKSPTLETARFNNLVQPLVFCDQAATTKTDWHTWERSLRCLSRDSNPAIFRDLMSEYMVKHPEVQLAKGPERAESEPEVDAPCGRRMVTDSLASAVYRRHDAADQYLESTPLDPKADIELIRVMQEVALNQGRGDRTAPHVKRIDAYVRGSSVVRSDDANGIAMLLLDYHVDDEKGSVMHAGARRLFHSTHASCLEKESKDSQRSPPQEFLELEALVLALNFFILRHLDTEGQSVERLTLKTQSSYCVSCCNAFLPKWREKDGRIRPGVIPRRPKTGKSKAKRIPQQNIKQWRRQMRSKRRKRRLAVLRQMRDAEARSNPLQRLWEAIDTRLMILRAFCQVSIEQWDPRLGGLDQRAFSLSGKGMEQHGIALCDDHANSKAREGIPFRIEGYDDDVDKVTRSRWSDWNPNIGSIDQVLVDACYEPKRGRSTVAAYVGERDTRNVAGIWTLDRDLGPRDEIGWGLQHAEMLAIVCGLDQILRSTLSGARCTDSQLRGALLLSNLTQVRDGLENLEARWVIDLRENPGALRKVKRSPQFAGKFRSLWIAIFARVLLIRCFRRVRVGFRARENLIQATRLVVSTTNAALASNQGVIDAQLEQLGSRTRLALDCELIASLHNVHKLPGSPLRSDNFFVGNKHK